MSEQASKLQDLRDRGVHNPEQFASLDAETIEQTLAWFDQQAGRVGVGVLVQELQAGGRKPAAAKQDLASKEAQYGHEVVAWLQAEMPELCRPKWGPHPAAVAALIRLDYVHGKTNRRKSTHGPTIRAAVKDWERKFGDKAEAAA
jgi:hypothetical protein